MRLAPGEQFREDMPNPFAHFEDADGLLFGCRSIAGHQKIIIPIDT